MRVVVVGSGTLVPDGNRGASAHWVETGEDRVLLDCGSGTERSLARFGLDWSGLSHIAITHFHVDHVGGLPAILFALRHGVEGGRARALRLLGPVGLRAHMRSLASVHGLWILDPGFPVDVVELAASEMWDSPTGSFRLTTVDTVHTDESVGYRLESTDGTVGYTGDTGFSPDLGPFFRGCQVLIAECSHPDGHGMENHLTPSELSEIATLAGPELLVPVHSYPSLDPAELPGRMRTLGYEGRVLPGKDGLGVHLQAGAVVKTEEPDR